MAVSFLWKMYYFYLKEEKKESDNKYIELIGIGDFRLFCVNSN
ncbi:hypothetical protein LEP1GSC068_3457 [Leptospira sp. Fiocruz LV3954]|uniref:Uncharacterized protein n=1 Tax=Leptospira santarosai str. MOR084 TaxID=1049984 RepID=A0A0E2BKE7_9LEPT|nr:hypothetical protein LEP1GSC179_2802 [Leptospira santarosai str. MOR084]EKO79884.1 hypothetical protein LEP1GSC068_3457 [Leptospira sp. Fiocruz LV3954]EMI61555.1 hypothetical protein LEP1GSC076_3540 [Leptospira sp. Fiocruz LV4135]